MRIVTGDTKVVDRGKGDGIFINTAGVGLGRRRASTSRPPASRPATSSCSAATWAGTAWPSCRSAKGCRFEARLESDCASLAALVEAMLAAGADMHCLRDLTRGGLAAALNEIALDARVGIEFDEAAIPVAEPVAAACELLGLDPLYVANEGRLVAFVPAAAAAGLEILRASSGRRRSGHDRHASTAEHAGHGRDAQPFRRQAGSSICSPANKCREFVEKATTAKTVERGFPAGNIVHPPCEVWAGDYHR